MMDNHKTLTANFAPLYTLTTEVYPSTGGSVSRNPNQQNYALGTNVTVTAEAKYGYTFIGWSGDLMSTYTSVTIRMDENKTLIAHFEPNQYTITKDVSPSHGGYLSLNPNQSSYSYGMSVTLTATVASDYTFVGYMYDREKYTNANVTINVDGDIEVTAYFASTVPGISGTFTDNRDGQTYKTVKIGNQTWMAENLNYQTTDGSWCYENALSYCNEYGRLYDWETAKTVCPVGWHLPTSPEWNILVVYAGGYPFAAKRLIATSGWYSNGTDEYGFSALPGGARAWGNDGNLFGNADRYGYWWTATHYTYSNERKRIGATDYSDVSGTDMRRDEHGYSVRCLHD